MLNRLGLVIHWIGLLASAILLISLISVVLEDGSIGIAGETAVVYLCAPMLGGWLFRFISTCHKSPLPWVANKEAT